MKQTEYKGLRFGSLSPEASDELHKTMLHGLKSINEYFDSKPGNRKLFVQDIKVATVALNTFAKIRQAESGFASVLLNLTKMSSEGKDVVKEFIIGALPQITESKAKE